MRISLVTDELSADPETAFELGLESGIRHFELRGMYTDRVPRLAAHARARLLRAIREFDVEITAVSPGLFKIPMPGEMPDRSNLHWMDSGLHMRWSGMRDLLADHTGALLEETIDFALETGTKNIISFGFHRNGQPAGPAPSQVVDCLSAAAERVGQAGLRLLVETEEGFWADTGGRTAALIEAMGSVGAGINWDPANAYCEGGEATLDGYAAIRGKVGNVHFKDASRDGSGSAFFTLAGDVDWKGQILALKQDGYDGFIAIEPHLERPVAAVRASIERLRRLMSETP